MKQTHFISGLPRAGNMLLCNILVQNPKFCVSGASDLISIINPLKNGWDNLNGHKQLQLEESRTRQANVLRGAIESYYQHTGKEVVFDKSRGWPQLAETLKWLYPSPKLLITVRNVNQVLQSMELMYRKKLATGAPGGNAEQTTMESRAKQLASPKGLVGSCFDIVRDCLNRGNLDIMHFVDYDDLTHQPEETLRGIYGFLELDYYDHDFNNVQQLIFEDDRIHGYEGLHTIRPEVKPTRHRNLFGDFGKQFEGQEFWATIVDAQKNG